MMVIDLFQKSPILHKGHVISKHNEKSLFLGQLCCKPLQIPLKQVFKVLFPNFIQNW